MTNEDRESLTRAIARRLRVLRGERAPRVPRPRRTRPLLWRAADPVTRRKENAR